VRSYSSYQNARGRLAPLAGQVFFLGSQLKLITNKTIYTVAHVNMTHLECGTNEIKVQNYDKLYKIMTIKSSLHERKSPAKISLFQTSEQSNCSEISHRVRIQDNG
jgi:hypothetical protein